MQKRLSMLSMLPVAVERSNWGRPMRWIKIVITEVFILLVVGTLDLNGFSQSFKKIAATDVGTIITNTSDKTATLSYKTPPAMSITVVSREIRISNTLGHRKVLTAV